MKWVDKLLDKYVYRVEENRLNKARLEASSQMLDVIFDDIKADREERAKLLKEIAALRNSEKERRRLLGIEDDRSH